MEPYLVQRFTANSRTVHKHDLDTTNKNLTDNKGLTHNSKSELSLFLKRKKKVSIIYRGISGKFSLTLYFCLSNHHIQSTMKSHRLMIFFKKLWPYIGSHNWVDNNQYFKDKIDTIAEKIIWSITVISAEFYIHSR